jgi:hypothetical protein
MIREREFLLAMRRVIGMIQVEDNSGGGLGVTRNKVVDKSLRQTVEVFAVDTMLGSPGE